MISSDDSDLEDNRAKSEERPGSKRNSRVRDHTHTTPPRRLRQRRVSEVSEAIITSPKKKMTEEERKEKARLRQQKCRSKKTSEEKAAANMAAKLRMSKHRDIFPESTEQLYQSTEQTSLIKKGKALEDLTVYEKLN